MKKSIVALAVLGACSGAAMAQSSVTVAGVMDAGVLHEDGNKRAGDTTSVASGSFYGSRVTFRGVEDLGGGVSASFWLENGLLLDTGAADQGGLLFGRQAYLALQSQYGTVRFGRQYVPIHSINIFVDPFEYAAVGGYLGVVGAAGNGNSRANNAVKYISPTLAGFKTEVLYGLGEAPGDARQGRQIGAYASYASGPLFIALVHHNSNNGTALAPVARINSTKNTAVSGTYDFGVAKASLIYQQNKDDLVLNSQDLMLGVSVPFGRSTFLGSYIYQKNKALVHANSNRISAGYLYALSKRSTLYVMASRIGNNSNARIGLAALTDDGTASGSSFRSYIFGMRHFF